MTPVRTRAIGKLPAYVLRDIPEDLWDAFRAKADTEGHSYRWILLQLLADYVARDVPKKRKPKPRSSPP